MMKMWLLLACAHMHSTHFFIGLTFSICGAGKREQIRVTAKGSKSCGKKTKAKGEDLLLSCLSSHQSYPSSNQPQPLILFCKS